MAIKYLNYDLNDGFAWGCIGHRFVQVCLVQSDWEPGQAPVFLPAINTEDCGHNDGICGDINLEIFHQLGESRVMKAFFKAAESAGIELI